MNVRLELEFSFVAGVLYQGRLTMNNYYGTLHFTTNTESAYEQNIAVDRIKFFISNVIEHSIFVNAADINGKTRVHIAGFNCIEMPEEPYDQIVNIMLKTKFEAITDERIFINDISLQSTAGGMVKFLLGYDESIGPFAEEGWWHDPTISVQNKEPDTDSVVELAERRDQKWEYFYLGWEEPEDKGEDNTSTIVVGNFNAKK